MFKKLNRYIARNFLMRFLQILIGFFLLIFFINFMDALEKVKGSDAPFYIPVAMAALQAPDFINDIIPSIILMSAIATFFTLSSKSELTVIRASGFSLWQIIRPMAMSAFLIGVLWITAVGYASIQMTKQFNALEGKYVRNEIREVVAPENGIWIRQDNTQNVGEDIIIKAEKIYKNNIELNRVTLWFYDKNGKFYQKIDADKMFLKNGFWKLQNVVINNPAAINKKVDDYMIHTDLEADFLLQKIVNNFQNVKLFSLFELPGLIDDLKDAGFSSTKFEVYFHSLLSKPLLFLAMIFIACFFGMNHVRDRKTILMIFLGITTGLILYITSTIIGALGSSKIIPIFASTWIIAIICLAIGILLIYKKENI